MLENTSNLFADCFLWTIVEPQNNKKQKQRTEENNELEKWETERKWRKKENWNETQFIKL